MRKHPEDYQPPESREELERRYAAGERCFPDTELSGADLSDVKLDGADFEKHSWFADANFSGASLRGTSFRECRFSDVELNWLRQLLRYRFNGTSVTSTVAGHISFEESADVEVPDGEIQKLLASPEFSKWVGSDLVRSLSRLTSARADLKSNAAQLPQHPEAFLRHATYKRYSSTANNFQRQLVRKFKIIAIDNLVDCD